MFDPWVEVAKYPHVEVRIERLNGKVVGLTNGANRIWLDDRLNLVEQRCVLTHEVVHLELGHSTCQPLRAEMLVCAEAARRLIHVEDLVRVLPWSYDLYELAEDLCVTPQTLRDRLMGLRYAERLRLMEMGVQLEAAQAA